ALSPCGAANPGPGLLHLPEPNFPGRCVVGVVAEPREPLHQPFGGGAIAVPDIDVITGGRRLAMPSPVVLDVDDARATEELLVEVRCLGAGDTLDFFDARD